MLLVIFGAGASYDSAPSKPPNEHPHRNLEFRLPLANELFSDRRPFGVVMNKYPECLAVIPELRHAPAQSSVEGELQRLQREADSHREGHQQLAAIRYYLQEVLWVTGQRWLDETQNISNYLTLTNRIKRWKQPRERVCFVTFNYDWLLEKALQNAGYPFTELSGYIARDLMLVKLHGSVNWGRIVRSPDLREHIHQERIELARHLIRNYSELRISQEYVLIGEYPPSPRPPHVLFPALAIPVETKLDFECPPEHVAALKSFIPEVTKILIIGWRATEQPFLDLLKNGLRSARPHFFIVNGERSASENTMNKIMRFGIPGNYTVSEQSEFGFSELIRQQKVDEFLSST